MKSKKGSSKDDPQAVACPDSVCSLALGVPRLYYNERKFDEMYILNLKKNDGGNMDRYCDLQSTK